MSSPALAPPSSATESDFTRRPRQVPLRLRARRLARVQLGIPRVVVRSLAYDLLAGACAGAFMGATMPFFIKIARDDLSATPTLIALMSASPFIGNFLAPVWARQMEGRGKIPFCVGAWTIARLLLLLLLLPFATGSAIFFVAVISALQFTTTIAMPAYTSLMRDIYPDRARGRLMGYVRVVLQATMFVATLVTGRLLDAGVTYQTLFPIAGMLGVGAAWAFSHVRPHDPDSTRRQEAVESARNTTLARFALETIGILRHNAGYRWFALSVMCYGFGNLMVLPLYGLYQVDVLHIQSTQIANLINFSSLMSIAGAFFWGRFIDQHGAPRTVLLSILIVSMIPIVYITAQRVETLFVASFLWGIGFAGIELSYMASILLYAEPGRAAQYQSLHGLLLGIRGVLAPLVSVPLAHAIGYRATFAIAMGIMLCGGLMQWLAARIHAQKMANAD